MAHTMEGFLYKKGSGKGVLTRTNWLRRWFELDGATLTYYKDFDPKISKPIGTALGYVNMHGARIESEKPHHTRKWTFAVTRDTGGLLVLEADSENKKTLWMEALDHASKKGREARSRVAGRTDFRFCSWVPSLLFARPPAARAVVVVLSSRTAKRPRYCM